MQCGRWKESGMGVVIIESSKILEATSQTK